MKNIYNVAEINKKMEINTRKLILDTESNYRGQLFSVVDKILKRKGVNLVLLAGPSCAGKTTTARLLKEILEKRGRNVITVSMDDFFLDRDKTPCLPNGLKDFDSPNSINMEQMGECFNKLFSEKEAIFPRFNFKTGKNNSNGYEIKLEYKTIIIFEGLHVLNPILLNYIQTKNYYKIYVNACKGYKSNKNVMSNIDERLFRRMVRDMSRRDLSVSDTLKNWGVVCDAENKYITPFKKHADTTIDTTHAYELAILKAGFDKQVAKGKASYDQLPFANVVKDIKPLNKALLPNTTLMWEFVDPASPSEQEAARKKIQSYW